MHFCDVIFSAGTWASCTRWPPGWPRGTRCWWSWGSGRWAWSSPVPTWPSSSTRPTSHPGRSASSVSKIVQYQWPSVETKAPSLIDDLRINLFWKIWFAQPPLPPVRDQSLLSIEILSKRKRTEILLYWMKKFYELIYIYVYCMYHSSNSSSFKRRAKTFHIPSRIFDREWS